MEAKSVEAVKIEKACVHRCWYCNGMKLDFSTKEPWSALYPLHVAASKLSNEAVKRIDPAFVHREYGQRHGKQFKYLRPLLRRSQFGRSLLANNLSSSYQYHICKQDSLYDQAYRNFTQVTTLDLTGQDCIKLAAEGCRFCIALLDSLESQACDNIAIGDHIFIASQSVTDGKIDISSILIRDASSFSFPHVKPLLTFQLFVQQRAVRGSNPGRGMESFGIKIPVNTTPGSPTSLKQLLSLYKACKMRHKACQPADPSFTPTRLLKIDIGCPDNAVSLVTDAKNVTYAALSYKWGEPKPGEQKQLQLRRSNSDKLLQGIRYTELPATILDAIKVCKALSIYYLWIDALCIFQDEEDDRGYHDKQAELKRMAEVYSNASLTIVASRADNVKQGFLADRQGIGWSDQKETFPALIRHYQTYEPVTLGPNLDMEDEPIDSRAWCLQERLMSHRIIDFGSRQTRWECCESRTDDSFISDELTYDGWNDLCDYKSERSYDLFQKFISFQARQSHLTKERMWHEIVMAYCKKDLTNATDRLVAIGAIAQVFSDGNSQEYWCGLWKNNLWRDLLWEGDFRTVEARHEKYLAPTWSWASLNRPVSFQDYWRPVGRGKRHDLVDNSPVCHDDFVAEAKIDCETPHFLYGKVRTAKLFLQAVSRSVLWAPVDEERTKAYQQWTLLNAEDKSRLPIEFTLDCMDPDMEEEIVQCGHLQVHLAVIGFEGNFSSSTYRDADSESRLLMDAPWHNSQYKNWSLPGDVKRKRHDAAPTSFLTGLVLREKSTGEFNRIGVFHTDIDMIYTRAVSKYWPHHSSTDPSDYGADKYYEITRWLKYGEKKSFVIV